MSLWLIRSAACLVEVIELEGRYSPIDVHGNRTSRNAYAKTREECEIKLAEMIAEMKAGIKAEKKSGKYSHRRKKTHPLQL